MEVRSALVAHSQATELTEPGQRPLNDPSVHPQPATMLCTPSGYHRRDVACMQGLPVCPRVIGTVCIQPLGSATRTTAFASDRRHGVHPWQPLRHIWPVRPGHNRGQRQPVGIGDPMMLTPGLAAVCGIGAGFSPQRLPHAGRRCPRRHETRPGHRPLAVWTTADDEAAPTRLLHATPSDDASRSSLNPTPSLGATSPTGCRSSGQIECRSTPCGRQCAYGQESGIVSAWEPAKGGGPFPRGHRSPMVWTFVPPRPVKMPGKDVVRVGLRRKSASHKSMSTLLLGTLNTSFR